MKICIVGDGGWGTALAMLLLENGHEVVVWGPFEDYLAEIRATGENVRYLPGVKLPRGLTWTSDPAAAAVGAGLVVLATPSHFYRGVCARFAGLVPADADVVSVAKGFCEETRGRLTATAAEALGVRGVAALSGPSHAGDVARGVPTAVVIASAITLALLWRAAISIMSENCLSFLSLKPTLPGLMRYFASASAQAGCAAMP